MPPPADSTPFTCLVAGDSSAVAVGKLLPECTTEAGRRTTIRDITLPGTTTLIVLSIGDTGRRSPTLEADVAALRARAGKRRVVWVLPANLATQAAVRAVAKANGDPVVTLPLDARKFFRV